MEDDVVNWIFPVCRYERCSVTHPCKYMINDAGKIPESQLTIERLEPELITFKCTFPFKQADLFCKNWEDQLDWLVRKGIIDPAD